MLGQHTRWAATSVVRPFTGPILASTVHRNGALPRVHRARSRGDDLYEALQRGDYAGTERLFSEMCAENGGSSLPDNIMACNTMLLLAHKKRDPESALGLFARIEQSRTLRPNFRTYSQIIVVLVSAMRMKEAHKFFLRLLREMDEGRVHCPSAENAAACAARVISRKDMKYDERGLPCIGLKFSYFFFILVRPRKNTLLVLTPLLSCFQSIAFHTHLVYGAH